MCRLPSACGLTAVLQVLYWGGEVTLMRGWYNSPEVTGDLMRGTWHSNVFCASSFLPMQMTVKCRSRSEGRVPGSFLQRRLRSLWKKESMKKSAKLKTRKPLHFLSPLCLLKQFHSGSWRFKRVLWRFEVEWLIKILRPFTYCIFITSYSCALKGRCFYLVIWVLNEFSIIYISLKKKIQHQKENAFAVSQPWTEKQIIASW